MDPKHNAPIKLTLYGENDEEMATYSRSFIPWKLLKRAIRISSVLETDEISEEALDELAQLVVDFYGGQFDLDDVNNGADASEMMAVLTAIVSRAGALSGRDDGSGPPVPTGARSGAKKKTATKRAG